MEAPTIFGRRVRVGLFEVDLSSGEVHKSGRRVPLQEQPFRVLAMLLERPGEIITREELQASLWPADTFVTFDEGINPEQAITLKPPRAHARKELAHPNAPRPRPVPTQNPHIFTPERHAPPPESRLNPDARELSCDEPI